MVGTEEKRRLMRQFDGYPVRPVIAQLKCAACLLILIFVVTAPWSFQSAGKRAGAGQVANAPEPSAHVPRAVASSKRVFDARRIHSSHKGIR